MRVKIHQCRRINHPFPILSWLIMLIQSINYSHYAIEYQSDGDDLVLDATSHSFREMSFAQWVKNYKITKTFVFNIDASEADVRKWANTHKGKTYGTLQVIGLLFIVCGLIKHNPFGSDNEKLTCNEAALLFLSHFRGLRLEDTDNYDMIDTQILIESNLALDRTL